MEAIQSITGESISFDVHSDGKQLLQDDQGLKQWWQEKRITDKPDEVGEAQFQVDDVEELTNVYIGVEEAEEALEKELEFR